MPNVGVTASGINAARQLELIGTDLAHVLNGVVRTAAPELVASARTAAKTLNIVGVTSAGKRKGKKKAAPAQGALREQIANAIDARFDGGHVTVFIDREKMPDGKAALPVLTAKREWRHPVFGNKNVWVSERARAGWFSKAVRQQADRAVPPELKSAIERLINDSARR